MTSLSIYITFRILKQWD